MMSHTVMRAFVALLTTLFISSSVVEGFAPPLSPVKTRQCLPMSGISSVRSTFVLLSQKDSNQDGSADSIADDDDDDEVDDYDFEAGFQARLQKEGGASGVQVKAAKRSMGSATKNAKKSLDSATTTTAAQFSNLGLPIGILALVVLLVVGVHFASPAPFETTSNGEQLGFGLR